jgi:hypothetical protein
MSNNSNMQPIHALLLTFLAVASTVASLLHNQPKYPNLEHPITNITTTTDLKAHSCHSLPSSTPDEHVWCHNSQTGWCLLTAFISHPTYSAIGWVFSSTCTDLGSNFALHCDPSIHSPLLPWVAVVNTYEVSWIWLRCGIMGAR